MLQIVRSFAPALQKKTELTLVTPSHCAMDTEFAGTHLTLPTPSQRKLRALYWFNPFELQTIREIIRGTQPDIVHLLNGQGYLFSLNLPAMLPSTPLIVTVHDPIAHSGSHADRLSVALGRRFLLPKAKRLHTMSVYASNLLVQQGFRASSIITTRHGALIENFWKHNRADVAREDVLLFFGRWEEYKGIDLLVDALLELRSRGITQRCILAGPGSVNSALKAKIDANPDVFEVHNRYLSDAEVAVLMQRARCTVLPYRDATQSSLPALAQAYGHLIVASSVGAFTEEVAELDGILVQPNSVDSLIQGILLARAKQAAPRHMDYSWDTVADQLVTSYSQCVGS